MKQNNAKLRGPEKQTVKGKFHYASWFEAMVRSWSQSTGSKLVDLLRPTFEVGTSFESASVMEFGFNRPTAQKFTKDCTCRKTWGKRNDWI